MCFHSQIHFLKYYRKLSMTYKCKLCKKIWSHPDGCNETSEIVCSDCGDKQDEAING